MIAFRDTNKNGIPCAINLLIGKFGFVGKLSYAVSKSFCCNLATLQCVKNIVLLAMPVKLVRIGNAQLLPGLGNLVKINTENYVSIIKNDVFYVGHNLNSRAVVGGQKYNYF